MADELLDDESTGIDALARRLLRRAAMPGVIRPDPGARIQRRFSAGGGGLAAEIWHRWSPAAPRAWGHGPGLVHAGSGGWAGAVSGPRSDLNVVFPPSPGGPGEVGSGEGPGAQVSTRRGSDAPISPAGAQEGLGAGSQGASRLRLSDPGLSPAVRSEGSGTPAAIGTGGAGSVGLVQRKAAAAMPSLPSGADAGPAIVRRAADPVLARPASALRFGAHMERAIFRRRSASTSAPSAMPLPRLPRVTAPAAAPPLRSEAESGPAIAHHPASLNPPPPRASLPPVAPGPLPSASLLLFAPTARTGRAVPAVSAALPVAAVSPAAAATRSSQPWRTASTVVGVQPAMTSNLLQASSLPFAHPARVTERGIERDVLAGTPPGTATDSAAAIPAAQPGPVQDAARPAATEKLDLDDLAERVLRRLTRSVAVERERHGGRRWP